MTVHRFFFPFTGKVKTQLKIAKKGNGLGLVKPKEVKAFENQVKTYLAIIFPERERPLSGYLRFYVNHYTKYRREKGTGLLLPEKYAQFDLDNLLKTIQDCFQPEKMKFVTHNKDGSVKKTPKGNLSYEYKVVVEGVITDDKYICRTHSNWVPVETEDEEGIEVFIELVEEEKLFKPLVPVGEVISHELK